MSSDFLDLIKPIFEKAIPFNRFLGLEAVEVEEGRVRLELPFREQFIGNPVMPALHGGVVSMLLDTAGGAAVWTRLSPADTVSTVDLRVDYLRPGRLERLVAVATVVRLGNRVGVVELRAFHPDAEEEPVAAGMGVYNVRRTKGEPGEDASDWLRVKDS
jgi:uncharacterized protein (TIGR00369 family)